MTSTFSLTKSIGLLANCNIYVSLALSQSVGVKWETLKLLSISLNIYGIEIAYKLFLISYITIKVFKRRDFCFLKTNQFYKVAIFKDLNP